jgi:hypothetical protein
MITTVTQKNMVIPHRGERARRLLGASRKLSPDRDAVADLVAERAAEG